MSRYTGPDGAGLMSLPCLAEIAIVSLTVRRETAQIESRHASIRRSLIGLSVQTHQAMFPHVSALRTTQEVRKLSKRWATATAPGEVPGAAAHGAGSTGPGSEQHRRACFGGAWRAFVREKTHGCPGKPDFKTIAAEYGLLDADRMEQLRKVAEDARMRRAAGSSFSFGLTTRQAARQQSKRKQSNMQTKCSMGSASESARLHSAGHLWCHMFWVSMMRPQSIHLSAL